VVVWRKKKKKLAEILQREKCVSGGVVVTKNLRISGFLDYIGKSIQNQ